MTMISDKDKKLHFDLTNVGLRAQATAAGLLQLCMELRRVDILDEEAVERIKDAIAREIEISAPRVVISQGYRQDLRGRLDQLFAGERDLGPAEGLAFKAPEQHGAPG
ncbi:hypothetical protein [Sphingobium cloacae]|uniref:Uncharacterized protein n=1 Tax=Sphingobium cloacae TaxID=120107 RepID=A0A1E1F0R9_9SPHN|nr:hypothetical protein [Sphingobium cloacae]BAV64110.1 hypothetical protein SCLO_1010700 [Sphingobium cloacae]